RHDLSLFGYGHFFIFAALAGLGSMLNLVTESVAGETGDSAKKIISEPYAMGMLMSMLVVFLLTLTILRELMCRRSSHNVIAMLLA
ncbi:hypothetical protein, partial [Pseudoalteromonas sp. 69-MNA-CIBAN-0232]